MSEFGYPEAALRRANSGQIYAQRAALDGTTYGPSRANRLPQYTFDPSTLLNQSIEAQLHSLYDRPAFDANPAHHYQQETTFVRSPYRHPTQPVRSGAGQRPSRPASATVHAYGASSNTVGRGSGAQPRRPASATVRATVLPAQPGLHPSPYVSSVALRSGPQTRTDGGWSRQQRKDELIDNGLEPLQNLVGLDSYFVERPPFANRTVSMNSNTHTNASSRGDRSSNRIGDSRAAVRLNFGDYRGGNSCSESHRVAAKPTGGASSSSVAGVLPLAPGRQPAQPSEEASSGLPFHSRHAPPSMHALATSDKSCQSSAAAAAVRSAARNSPPPPPATSAVNTTDAAAAQSPLSSTEINNRTVNGAPHESTSSSSSSLAESSTSSSGSSASGSFTNTTEGEVFFDEDPLNVQLNRSGTTASTKHPRHPAETRNQADRRHLHNNTTGKGINGVSAPRIAPEIFRSVKGRRAVPMVLDIHPVPPPSASASAPVVVVPIPVENGTPQNSPNRSATSPAAEAAAAVQSKASPPPPPMPASRSSPPPPPPRPASDVAVDLDTLGDNARRRSIDALLERLLQLRVQHQRSSHTSAKCPSPVPRLPMTLAAAAAAAAGGATGGMRSSRKGPLRRTASNSVRSRRSSASRSRQSNTVTTSAIHSQSQKRRGPPAVQQQQQRRPVPSQSLHDSFYAASSDNLSPADDDEVYVRLYRRYRRCECCEVPLPRDVVRPRPPSQPRGVDQGERRSRRGRRAPDVPVKPEPAGYAPPLPCERTSPIRYADEPTALPSPHLRDYYPYEEADDDGDREAAVERRNQSRMVVRGAAQEHQYNQEPCEAQQQPEERVDDGDNPQVSLPAAFEQALLQCVSARFESRGSADEVAEMAELVQAFVKDLQQAAQQQQQQQQQHRQTTEAALQSLALGHNSADVAAARTEEQRNALQNAQRVFENGVDEPILDDAFAEELLRLLSNDGRVAPLLPGYAQVQEQIGTVPTTQQLPFQQLQQQQQYYPYFSSRLPCGAGPNFMRTSPYGLGDQLYPYNIPHPPPPRDASVDTVAGTARESRDATVNLDLSEVAPPPEQPTSPAQPQGEATSTQHSSDREKRSECQLHEEKTEKKGADPQAPLPPLMPKLARVVEDKSVQTSLPSSRRNSAIPKLEEDVTVGQAGPSATEAAPSASAPPPTGAATQVAEEHASNLSSSPQGQLESPKEPAVPTSVSRASLSSFAASALAAMTPSPSSPSPEKLAPPSPLPNTDRATEGEEAPKPQSSPKPPQPPSPVCDVQAAIQESVLAAQLELLQRMEETLRDRLRTDEADARRDVAAADVQQRETAERWAIGGGEVKERQTLQRGSRYARDRLLVMEMALKEWSQALGEEREAWAQMTQNAAAEAAATEALVAAKARLKERVEELLYDEARLRRSVRLTESLVRQELQLSICDYEENYSREEVDYAELVDFLEVQRTFLLSAPRPAPKSPSPLPGVVHVMDDGVMSVNTSSDPYSSDFVSSANQSNVPDRANAKSEAGQAAMNEQSHWSEKAQSVKTESSMQAHSAHDAAPPPFLTPALLLSNEVENEDERTAPPLAESDSHAVQQTHVSSERSPTLSEESEDNEQNPLPQPDTPTVSVNAASTSVSQASALSGGFVFGSRFGTPEPDVAQDKSTVKSAQPPTPSALLKETTPALADSTTPPQLTHQHPPPQHEEQRAQSSPASASEASTPETKIVVHVVKENILPSPVPADVAADALAATPVAELLISPSKVPPLTHLGDSVHAKSGAEGTTGGVVVGTAAAAASNPSSDEHSSFSSPSSRSDASKNASESSVVTQDEKNAQEGSGSSTKPDNVLDAFTVSAPTNGNASGAVQDMQPHPQSEGNQIESTAESAVAKEHEKKCEPTTVQPTTKQQKRPSLVPPLATPPTSPAANAGPQQVVSALTAAATSTTATTLPDDATHGHVASSVSPYNAVAVVAPAAEQEAEEEDDTETNSENASAGPGSNRRKRRLRRNTRHRTAKANAIDFEEAGEIAGSDDDKVEDERGDDEGNAASSNKKETPTPELVAVSTAEQHGPISPPPWREIGESSGFPQTQTFHSGVYTAEINEEDEEEDEEDVNDGESEKSKDAEIHFSHAVQAKGETTIEKEDSAAHDEAAGAAAAMDREEETSLNGKESGDDAEEKDTAKASQPAAAAMADTTLSGDEDDNNAFIPDAFGAAAQNPLSVTEADIKRDKREAGVTSVSSLQAENINYESSTDDRRFISPLSTRSEVNTPHVNSQDDYSYCSTPASAKPPLEEHSRTDDSQPFPSHRRYSFGREQVQLPAALAQGRPESATSSSSLHPPAHHHHQHHSPHSTHSDQHPSQQEQQPHHLQAQLQAQQGHEEEEDDGSPHDLMPSLSASSLSSPHLLDPDAEEENEEPDELERNTNEDEREQDEEDEDEGDEEADEEVVKAEEVASKHQSRSHNGSAHIEQNIFHQSAPEDFVSHESAEATGERRRSSCTGKDEVTLMHERIEAMKKAAHDSASGSTSGGAAAAAVTSAGGGEAGKSDTIKIGQGFTKHPDRPRPSMESQVLLDQRERRTSQEASEPHLDEAARALADHTSAESKSQLLPQSRSNSLRDKDGVHASFVDQSVDGSRHAGSPHDDLVSGAVSHSSLGGSPASVSVAMSKTLGTYYGSLDSDALTPVTRRVRAKCWEETAMAAAAAGEAVVAAGEAAAAMDADEVPRPPTPEFVRNVLAFQMKHLIKARGTGEEVGQQEALTTHVPLSQVWDGDRGNLALTSGTGAASSRRASSSIGDRRDSNSTTHDDSSPFASYGARAEADIREEFPRRQGANYVKADDDDDDGAGREEEDGVDDGEGDYDPPHLVATVSVNQKVLALTPHGAMSSRPPQQPQSHLPRQDNTPLTPPTIEMPGGAKAASPPAFPPSTTPQRPPFPWETAAAETRTTGVAETNELIPLKQTNEDVWNSGAPNRFTRLRVRVPSPHPRVLRRNAENNSEESTSMSADDDSSNCMTPNVNDTRFMTAMPSGSLRSEDLVVAEMQKGVRMHLVDSFTDSASLSQKSHGSPKQ